jgi:hypothetical protein
MADENQFEAHTDDARHQRQEQEAPQAGERLPVRRGTRTNMNRV